MERPLSDIMAALRDGRVTSAGLMDAAAANRDKARIDLNAYKQWDGAGARVQAQMADQMFAAGRDLGPLHGLPVSIKDLYGVPGLETFAGSNRQLPKSWQAPGPVVQAVLNQMAVVTGKTHTVEFAFGGIGSNPHWGTPRNPWDANRHRVPGGSSSGAGVSLAEGSALLALGTDTAGSVRIPASWTGNVGIKTTWDRWSLDGIVPLSFSLDTAGVLARTAADASIAFSVIDGSEPQPVPQSLAGIRIGVCEDFYWDDCSPGVAEAVRTALSDLERAGAQLVPVTFTDLSEVDAMFRKGGLAAVELYDFLRSELPDWIGAIDANVQQRMAEAESLPAAEYLGRKRALARMALSADADLASVDALAAPTVAISPPTVDEIADGDVYREKNLLALRNTMTVNYLSLCAVTLPVGLDALDMPVGMQLIGRNGDDARVVALAQTVENVLGTAAYRLGRPPLRAAAV